MFLKSKKQTAGTSEPVKKNLDAPVGVCLHLTASTADTSRRNRHLNLMILRKYAVLCSCGHTRRITDILSQNFVNKRLFCYFLLNRAVVGMHATRARRGQRRFLIPVTTIKSFLDQNACINAFFFLYCAICSIQRDLSKMNQGSLTAAPPNASFSMDEPSLSSVGAVQTMRTSLW